MLNVTKSLLEAVAPTLTHKVVGAYEGVPTEYLVTATVDGKTIGKASVKVVGKSKLRVAGITVDESSRRQGVASQMLSYIENQTGRTLVPGLKQTPDGKAMWANRKGRFGPK